MNQQEDICDAGYLVIPKKEVDIEKTSDRDDVMDYTSIASPIRIETVLCRDIVELQKTLKCAEDEAVPGREVNTDITFTTQYVISLGTSNNLASSIGKKTFQPDHCDLHLGKVKDKRGKVNDKPRKVNDNPRKVNEKPRKVNDKPLKVNEKTGKVNTKTGKVNEKTRKANEKTTELETLDSNTVSIKIKCVNGNLILKPVKDDKKENVDNIQTDDENNDDADDDDDFDGDDSRDSDTESDSESTATIKEVRTNDVCKSRVKPDKPKSGKPKQPLKVKALLKQYNITELTHEEQLKDLENRKVKLSYRGGYHKCLKCFKGFFNKKNYKVHMDKHTDKYGECVCPVCGLHYRSAKQVGRHAANVHRRRFSCYSCSFVTNEKSAAMKHLECHQMEYFTCPHCLEELRSKSYYLAHLRTVHCAELSCALCKRSFKSEQGLRAHINLKHYKQDPKKPLYVCGECHMRFSCEAAYRQHLESHSHKHSKDGNAKRKTRKMVSNPNDVNKRRVREKLKEDTVPVKDDEEDYIPTVYLENFDDYIDLESTVKNEADIDFEFTHANTREYRSRTIDDTTLEPKIVARKPKKDVDYGYLKQYTITQLSHEQQCEDIQKRKESTNFLNSHLKCVICFKGFRYIKSFNIHMDKHTDKYGHFECPVCFLHFPKRVRLRNHMVSNHSRRYACKSCSLVTNHSNTARNHANWHKGTVYRCIHCPEEFQSKTSCWSHMRILHPTDAVCALCGLCFVNERGLQKHVHMTHRLENVQNPDGPPCGKCGVRFASGAAYRQHLRVSPQHATRRELKRNDPLTQRPKIRGIKKSNDTTTCEQVVEVKSK